MAWSRSDDVTAVDKSIRRQIHTGDLPVVWGGFLQQRELTPSRPPGSRSVGSSLKLKLMVNAGVPGDCHPRAHLLTCRHIPLSISAPTSRDRGDRPRFLCGVWRGSYSHITEDEEGDAAPTFTL